jgi:hypothetical protein
MDQVTHSLDPRDTCIFTVMAATGSRDTGPPSVGGQLSSAWPDDSAAEAAISGCAAHRARLPQSRERARSGPAGCFVAGRATAPGIKSPLPANWWGVTCL